MRTLLSVLFVLCWSTPALAEMPTSHKIGLSTYAVSAGLDYHSTFQNLSRPGGVEHNPLGRLTVNDPIGTVTAGVAIDVAVSTLVYKWLGKSHPKWATAVMVGASAVRLHYAAGNYRNWGLPR